MSKLVRLHEEDLKKSNEFSQNSKNNEKSALCNTDNTPQFDEVENYVPLDVVAESTIPTLEKVDDDTDSSNHSWLATVASRISSHAGKTNSTSDHSPVALGKVDDIKRSISAADLKLSMDDVFYWFCVECEVQIYFWSKYCYSCGKRRFKIESAPSALLDVAEKVFHDGIGVKKDVRDILEVIPQFLRRCFPKEVLNTLMNHFLKKSVEIGSSAYYFDLDSLFYWECEECASITSFRRWFCPTCKRKVSSDVDH